MVIGDLEEVIAGVDSEMHEIERATHEKRMELELERKKHEINLWDAITDTETMHNKIAAFKKEIIITKECN
jgi:hypothetical protein